MIYKLLYLLCFLLPIRVSAQSESHHNMLNYGKSWVYDYHHFEEHEDEPTTETVYPARYTILGDTLIDNKSYYKMYQEVDNKNTYYAAYREDGLKVFARFPLIDEDIIVADFEYKGLYDPDGYGDNDSYSAVEEYVDYIEVNGIKYRRHTYYEDDKENKLVIGVEGIGYTKYGLQYPSIYGPEPDCLCDYKVFTSCEMNGECIFTNEDFYKEAVAQEYFPEGTKWTEIRLDTLKYDSWYSKDGEEWMPNFETVEYYVQGTYTKYDETFKCVYTSGPTWTDSLTLMILEKNDKVSVSVPAHNDLEELYVPWPGTAYQFDWSIGKGLYYENILQCNTTDMQSYHLYYGIIDEIKDADFGGVRPLQYVDLDGKAPEEDISLPITNLNTEGGRIIHGIGITEWKDGECLFGPPTPYDALSMFDYNHGDLYPQRHYRSMLVHFERNGDVLYNSWPKKGGTDGIKSVNKEETPLNNIFYDLQGRRLNAQPSKGVFIQSGKKVVVR